MKQHRHDEPTLLPSNHYAIVIDTEGNVTLYMPTRDPDSLLDRGAELLLRAAVLFGEGEDSDEARQAVDELVNRLKSRVKGTQP